jgi:PhnO protein
MAYTVRTATPEDLIIIHRFICELEETEFPFSLFGEYYQKNLLTDNFIYLVAVDENNIVHGYLSCHGQLLLHHCGWVFEIQEMFVPETERNKGIGRLLLKQLEKKLSSMQACSLEVTANIHRTNAHNYYKSLGFRETHKKFTK